MPVRPTRCSKLCHLLLKYLIGEDMECGGFLFEMSVSFDYLPKKGIGVFGNIEARLARANRCGVILTLPYAPE